MGLMSYEPTAKAGADKSALDMDKHPGTGAMKFPMVTKDDDAHAKLNFDKGIFKISSTGQFVVVYLGEDYFNYCYDMYTARQRYDIADVMPTECMAQNVQRFLLLSILQAMCSMQKADQFVAYMESYLYKFYMQTATPNNI
jgi:hypothetical protein